MQRVADVLSWTVRFFRPEFWAVSVFPAWVGWVLATGELFPEQAIVLAGHGDVLWLERHWRAVLGLITFGPFLGGAMMVMNDYYDREADVFNPKKATSPLVQGTATPQRALAWMVSLSLATIVSGFVLAMPLGLLLTAGIGLSFAYSAPPLRLKARPLGDVLVNSVGFGAMTLLAGWGLGSAWEGPWPLGPMLITSLAIAAGYLPTVMMDVEADRQAGLSTSAVTLGLNVCWLLGIHALVVANATMMGLAAMGRYVGPNFVMMMLPFMLVEGFAYATLVRRDEPDLLLWGGSIVTMAFFGNLGVFLLVYTGLAS